MPRWMMLSVAWLAIAAWGLQLIVGCAASHAGASDNGRSSAASGIGTNSVNFGDEHPAGGVSAPAATQPTATLPALLSRAIEPERVGNSPETDQKSVGQVAANVAANVGLAVNQSMSLIMAVLLIMLDRSKTQTVEVLSSSWGSIVEKLLGAHGSTVDALTDKLHRSTPVDPVTAREGAA